MSYSIHSSNHFHHGLLPDALFKIIGGYLSCASEAKEALCLQASQSKESLDSRICQITQDIWRVFEKNVAPRNTLVHEWAQKCSKDEIDLRERFNFLQVRMADYIVSKIKSGKESVDFLESQFPGRNVNLLKLEALTNKMNEAMEFDSLKKIVTCIAKEVSTKAAHDVKSLADSAAIRTWIDEHKEAIGEMNALDLSQADLNVIPELFLDIYMPNMRIINLSSNDLRGLPKSFGLSFPKLTTLYLNKNRIRSLPDQFGGNWPRLSALLLEENALQTIPPGFGSSWNELLLITLHKNQIQLLPNGFGDNWSKLSQITLHSNQLKSLPDNFGSPWAGITHINLLSNRLESLPKNSGSNWSKNACVLGKDLASVFSEENTSMEDGVNGPATLGSGQDNAEGSSSSSSQRLQRGSKRGYEEVSCLKEAVRRSKKTKAPLKK